MTWQITTTDAQRRQLWQHLFGRDELPVLAPRPRWQWLPGRKQSNPAYEALAYDLDVRALPDGALARLAAYIAERSGWPYDYARAAVQGGWAITAVNCQLVAPEGAKEEPAQSTSAPARFVQPDLFARQQVLAFHAS